MLPDYEQALEKILEPVVRLGTTRLPLARASGRLLRRGVCADRDQPPFDRATMDGFAVSADQVKPGALWPVAGSVPAGAAPAKPLPAGAALRIATGAPMPVGADVVVPLEEAALSGCGSSRSVRFRINGAKPWLNVHRRAADARRGDPVVAAGTILGPHHLGMAAAVGATSLTVTRRARVTLLTTGDEVKPHEVRSDQLAPHQIRNSNGPMMAAFLKVLGARLTGRLHLADDAATTVAAIDDGWRTSDLVLTTGGVSVGWRDLVPQVQAQLHSRVLVHGVAIQPGKPLLVARQQDRNALLIGLPGNPASVFATAHLFVWPVLLKMAGLAAGLPWKPVELVEPVQPRAARQVFRAAKLIGTGRASVIPWQGSGDLIHTSTADGLVRLPLQDEPVDAFCQVPFLPLAGVEIAGSPGPVRDGAAKHGTTAGGLVDR